uniref:DDHD domain-containing protein n=1 Tax=Timema genevievae TaxID=629358 RepID=A0A7R9PH11_TIMGE|nr:unnamed protein product [Timema genevievae]
MLIKEYRIPLPLTVEEYRIAQLFMIAKKSREESKGAGSGVEILVNEPYEDGPGGHGQYTHKIYHVGSHLPGWFKSLLPKSALTVEEEAWNAYPYTKTRYTCPFVEKFSLEIETYYFADNGHQENVFKLTGSDLRNRVVDLIDVVKDQLYGADYVKEEDPKYYLSQKTGRGPLVDSWLEDYWNECKGKQMPLSNGKSIMCAYKLCRVEFRYWGMQTKLEKFIHDIALRKTMVRAHRQAWAWQDEWQGLTMDDIRQIERQTQEALKQKMGSGEAAEGAADNSKVALHSPSSGSGKSFDLQMANWRMESIVRDSDSASDEEFFDCQDLLTEEDLDAPSPTSDPEKQDSIFCHTFLQRVVSERGRVHTGMASVDVSCPGSPVMFGVNSTACKTTVLLLALHAGSVLDANVDLTAKKSDITTFRGAFELVMRQHYPSMVGRIAIKLVSCPSICTEGLGVLSSLSPYSFDVSPSCMDVPHVTHDSIPIGAIPLFATSSPDYQDAVSRVIGAANCVYQEFIKSDEGQGFTGQICFVGDGVGSILGYDSLCRSQQYQSRHDSENSILDTDTTQNVDDADNGVTHTDNRHLSAPNPRRRSSSTSPHPEANCAASLQLVPPHGPGRSSFGAAAVGSFLYAAAHQRGAVSEVPTGEWTALPPFGSNPDKPPDVCRGSECGFRHPWSLAAHVRGQHPEYGFRVTQKWWGNKRLDYALYCPEGLANFPTNALPHLFHASYWESSDVIAFILRQNVAANHRGNDVIVKEGAPQVLVARFMYGPLDMITLAGDHTCMDMYMAVVPPKTECVVFSIDGSFTASMSVTGRDPKVRAGAVDIVRHWQELGYLIIYITGRPDMQQQKVVSWLSQHNFPHGLVSFADGLSTDPLGHKATYLKNLIQEHGVIIHASYGSSKDISVYTSIGLKPKQIFVVGKVSKKHHSLSTVLQDGYAAHLTLLLSHGGSRPAQGNARMVIPRGYFGLPGQNASLRRRRYTQTIYFGNGWQQ